MKRLSKTYREMVTLRVVFGFIFCYISINLIFTPVFYYYTTKKTLKEKNYQPLKSLFCFVRELDCQSCFIRS